MADEASLELARNAAAAMYAEDEASRALGIVIDDVRPGRATARMTVTSAMVNGHALAHGGYIFLLADTAFAFACNTYGRTTVAGAAQVVYLQPARQGDELIAAATERHRAGRSGIYDVTVRLASGEVVAEFRGHSRELRPGTEPAATSERRDA